jgi:hypothetical protein
MGCVVPTARMAANPRAAFPSVAASWELGMDSSAGFQLPSVTALNLVRQYLCKIGILESLLRTPYLTDVDSRPRSAPQDLKRRRHHPESSSLFRKLSACAVALVLNNLN